MNSIKAVLFDLDNTLIERARALPHVAKALIRQYFKGRESESDFLTQTFCECFKDGYLKNKDCFATYIQEVKWENPPPYDEFFMYWSFFYPYNATPVDNMREVLEYLKEKKYLLGIITNGPITMQNAKIEVVGIRELFDLIVVSRDYGVEKPNAEIFTYAANRLGLLTDECLYVGDHPRNDVFGAMNAGMHTAWYNAFVEWDSQYKRADVEIDGLLDLKKLL